MSYIEAFLAHLFANLGGIFGNASTLHSTTTLGGTWTTSTGSNTMDDADNMAVSLLGATVVSVGTAVIEASDDALSEYKRQAASVATTQAYIESLPENELDELIETLTFAEPTEPKEEVRTLAKRL